MPRVREDVLLAKHTHGTILLRDERTCTMRHVMLARSMMVAFLLAAVGCADAPQIRATTPPSPAVDPWSLHGVARIKNDAQRLERLVKSEQVKRFLQQAVLLPSITARKLFV